MHVPLIIVNIVNYYPAFNKPAMNVKSIDAIVENLFYVIPIIHKKLMKVDRTTTSVFI